MKLYWITKIWPKWQVVIPQEARQDLWLKPWDKVVIFSPSWKWIVIVPAEEIKKYLGEFGKLFEGKIIEDKYKQSQTI